MDNTYIINNGEENISIYPLLKIELDNKEYLIYSNQVLKNFNLDDFFVGEIKNDDIIPVDVHVISKIENIVNNSYVRLKNGFVQQSSK